MCEPLDSFDPLSPSSIDIVSPSYFVILPSEVLIKIRCPLPVSDCVVLALISPGQWIDYFNNEDAWQIYAKPNSIPQRH